MKIKYFALGIFSAWIIFLGVNHFTSQWRSDDTIRTQAATIARQQLIIDSLRNPGISDSNGTTSTIFRSDTGVIAIADSVKTLTIEHVGINRFWYNDVVQFTINGHDDKGRYLMHIDKHRLKWLNDTTAIYRSYNPIDTTEFLTEHSEITR